MGDIFKAMQRSRQTRGQDAEQEAPSTSSQSSSADQSESPVSEDDREPSGLSDDATPALPLDSVNAKSLADEIDAPARRPTSSMPSTSSSPPPSSPTGSQAPASAGDRQRTASRATSAPSGAASRRDAPRSAPLNPRTSGHEGFHTPPVRQALREDARVSRADSPPTADQTASRKATEATEASTAAAQDAATQAAATPHAPSDGSLIASPPPTPAKGSAGVTRAKSSVPAFARNHGAANGYSADLVVHHDRGSVIAEQYRAIRLQILSRSRSRNASMHVVTSSVPQEGKSVTTLNLGVAFSELMEARTVLLEGDLRRPSFGRLLQREVTPGLTHLLRGEASLEEVCHKSVYENLTIIPAGHHCANSTELLSSQRMREVLERLRETYDHVLIDSPPVIHVTDACMLGSMSDDVLLVVRLNRTPTEVVDRAKRLLRAAHCEVAGVVLTHQQYHIPNYLYQYV